MAKGMDIVNKEYDSDGTDHRGSRVNKPHAREHKPHISAENSTSPHKPGKKDFGNLGMRPR